MKQMDLPLVIEIVDPIGWCVMARDPSATPSNFGVDCMSVPYLSTDNTLRGNSIQANRTLVRSLSLLS